MKKLILLLLAVSCANHIPTLRSSYELGNVDDFLISNIYVNPVEVDSNERGVHIKYDLIVKNLKNSTRKVDLNRSLIGNQFAVVPLNCQSYENREKAFSVQANATFKIECTATIGKNSVHSGDAKLDVAVSLEKSAAIFRYVVRAEDFK